MENLIYIERASSRLPVYLLGDKEACEKLFQQYEGEIQKTTLDFEPNRVLVMVFRYSAFIEIRGKHGKTKTIVNQPAIFV